MKKHNTVQIFRFVKQGFIVLVLCFWGSLGIKCVSLNNQPSIDRSIFIELNPDELHFYPFMVSLNRCDEKL